MKKAVGLTALILSVLAMSGCGKSEPEAVVPEAVLSAEALVFDQSGSQKTVYLKLQGGLEVSSVDSSEPWCTARLTGDGSVDVTVSENDTEAVRSAVVTLSFSLDAFADKAIKVSQEAGVAKVLKTTAVDGYSFDCRGGEYKFTVESTNEWKAELVDCAWAEISTDGNIVIVKAVENEGETAREGKVKVISGDKSLEYSFTQGRVADNAYLKLLGEYDIYAENWYAVSRIDNNNRGICYSKAKSGTLAELDDTYLTKYETTFSRTATLVEDKYGESYYLNDFLIYGMNLPVNFDKKTGNVSFPSMWNIGFVQQADKDYAAVFMVGYWVDGGYVYFDRYNPYLFPGQVSEDGKTITVTTGLNKDPSDGSASLVPGSGICLVYMDMSLQSPTLTPFLYECMPYGDCFELRKKASAE